MIDSRRAAVVTIGGKNESLGAIKLAAWLRGNGWRVEQKTRIEPLLDRFDLWCFSCVFSWKLPQLVRDVRTAKAIGGEIWIGGPAVSFHKQNAEYVEKQTGIAPLVGLDPRFEDQRVACGMTYFSRGCPAYTSACGVCPVPLIEGRTFRFYPAARCARLLLDNNLSALPPEYQRHIIERYAADWKSGKVDANSGFEPHTFDDDTLQRWRRFPLLCWRFGYDDLSERDQAIDMLQRLKAAEIGGRQVRVYCLIGNEPIADCRRRLDEIIAHGAEPRPQRLRPLNWRSGPLPTRYDWDEQTLIAYQRYYTCPQIWKRVQPRDFYYQGRYPLRTAP